jgi:uncharacterized protein YpbB
MCSILFTLADINIPSNLTWVGLGAFIMFVLQMSNYLWGIIKARDRKRDEMKVMQVKIDEHDKELKGIHTSINDLESLITNTSEKTYSEIKKLNDRLGIEDVEKAKKSTYVDFSIKQLIEKYGDVIIRHREFENRIEEVVTGNENRIKELEKKAIMHDQCKYFKDQYK